MSDDFRDAVLAGLRARPKTLPCRFFYDAEGSRLFDEITALEAYYPTRTELAIMQAHAAEMADLIGPGALVIEYGSGSSVKTRLLLDALREPAAYVPLDISCEHLARTAEALTAAYPALEIHPVCADYNGPFVLPEPARPVRARVVYFPGSTIGNFRPDAAAGFLARLGRVVGPGGRLLIGVDLKKDRAVLERAYDDEEGVTARFNRNLLARINRELGADFPVERFAHRAFYDEAAGRIEMHLVSEDARTVHVAGVPIRFEAGESIHTEDSHKYDLAEFAALAARAGFAVERIWTDPKTWFSVQLLRSSTFNVRGSRLGEEEP